MKPFIVPALALAFAQSFIPGLVRAQDPQKADLRIYATNRHGVSCYFLNDGSGQAISLSCSPETAAAFAARGEKQAARPDNLHSLNRGGVTCAFLGTSSALSKLSCFLLPTQAEPNDPIDIKGKIHSANRNDVTCYYLGEGAKASEVSCFVESKTDYATRTSPKK